MSWGSDTTEFMVEINDEGQYSIWPSYKSIPAGWRAEGKRGNKADCLAHIDAERKSSLTGTQGGSLLGTWSLNDGWGPTLAVSAAVFFLTYRLLVPRRRVTAAAA